MTPVIVAHRTCPYDAAENSLAGITVAAQQGADAVEVDVRVTRDGVPILMHDAWLWRTVRKVVPARRLTAEQIAKLQLVGGAEPPPSLSDALTALPQSLRIALEVKDAPATAAVLAEVRRHALEERVLLWAESEAAVVVALAHRPRVEVALLRDTWLRWRTLQIVRRAHHLGAQAVSLRWGAIDEQVAREVRRCGLRLYSYCKKREPDLDRVALVDGLITDWPRTVRERLRQHAAAPASQLDG